MYNDVILYLIAALLLGCLLLLVLLLSRQKKAANTAVLDWQRQQEQLNVFANDVLDDMEDQRRDVNAAQNQLSNQLTASLSQLMQTTAQLDARMEQLRGSVQGSMTALRQDNDRQLTEMRRTVDEKLTASLDKRLNDSFAQVSQRLEQVYKGLGEMQTLASGVGDLKKVLTNVKTRGIWGEMQLGALLSQTLAPNQYETNVALIPGKEERVEFAIRLPGQQPGETVYLPIDAKFPQEDYLRLMDMSREGNAAAAEEARKALMTRVRAEAKKIASKYLQAPYTTDFAIMFLPVEGLYAEVIRDNEVTERIQQEHRVVIAGPSTFAALLNALQMGFRTLAIQQRSGEVWQLLSAVRTDFGTFADLLEKTRLRLQQATDTIDTAFSKTRTIQRKLGAVSLPGEEESEALPGHES